MTDSLKSTSRESYSGCGKKSKRVNNIDNIDYERKGAAKPLLKFHISVKIRFLYQMISVILSEYLLQILLRCCGRADSVIFHKEIQYAG